MYSKCTISVDFYRSKCTSEYKEISYTFSLIHLYIYCGNILHLLYTYCTLTVHTPAHTHMHTHACMMHSPFDVRVEIRLAHTTHSRSPDHPTVRPSLVPVRHRRVASPTFFSMDFWGKRMAVRRRRWMDAARVEHACVHACVRVHTCLHVCVRLCQNEKLECM